MGALSIFFMVYVVFGSRPMRGPSVSGGRILLNSTSWLFKGPTFLLFRCFGEPIGMIGTVFFWMAFLGTASCSRHEPTRRWFYVLYGVFIAMSLLGTIESIASGSPQRTR
jgi:hypothetical protein